MKKVLILMGRYIPGYKDGGPVRTIKNLTDFLGKEYEFYIMCSDRDRGDTNPYTEIEIGNYNTVGNAKVYYVKDGRFRFKIILNETINKDIVYCCGLYNSYAIKVMILKKFGFIRQNLIVASMGTFSKGALALKNRKKDIFFKITKFFGLYKKIIWSVTSDVEERELKSVLGNNLICYIAEDLPRQIKVEHKNIKKKNEIKIVFLSRICKMKNLLYCIDILSQLKTEKIVFEIYGNIEDEDYWNECLTKLKFLSKNIHWKYKGECLSEHVVNVFSNYDVFLFPTKGENFGHVIGEALLAGCIPIISENTPWNELTKMKCGNVINLKDIDKYIATLKEYILMDEQNFMKLSNNAQKYINEKNAMSLNNTGYRRIFNL